MFLYDLGFNYFVGSEYQANLPFVEGFIPSSHTRNTLSVVYDWIFPPQLSIFFTKYSAEIREFPFLLGRKWEKYCRNTRKFREFRES